MKRSQREFHLILKSFALFFVLAGTIIAIFTYSFATLYMRSTFADIQSKAMGSAFLISKTVDFSGHETLKDPEQESSIVYKRIFDDLQFAAEIDQDIIFVYTMRPKNNDQWEFVVDADTEVDDNGNGIIDEKESSADIGRAIRCKLLS